MYRKFFGEKIVFIWKDAFNLRILFMEDNIAEMVTIFMDTSLKYFPEIGVHSV